MMWVVVCGKRIFCWLVARGVCSVGGLGYGVLVFVSFRMLWVCSVCWRFVMLGFYVFLSLRFFCVLSFLFVCVGVFWGGGSVCFGWFIGVFGVDGCVGAC